MANGFISLRLKLLLLCDFDFQTTVCQSYNHCVYIIVGKAVNINVNV
jgi:hypothetical protein